MLQEIRELPNKRAIFATHSPFFIDVHTIDDLKGLVCFHGNEKLPTQYQSNPNIDIEIQKLLPHLGAEHRSFYFAQHPVFVEGFSDSTLIRELQRQLDLDLYASNSSIISLNGKDNVARAFALSYRLGKEASAILDLDALFDDRFIETAQLNPELDTIFLKNGQNSLEDVVKDLRINLEALEQDIKKSTSARLRYIRSGRES